MAQKFIPRFCSIINAIADASNNLKAVAKICHADPVAHFPERVLIASVCYSRPREGGPGNQSTLHGDWDQLTLCKHLTQRSDCTYNSPSLSLWIHFSYSIAYLKQFLKILSVENLSDLKYLYIFKISVCSRKFSLKEKLANLSANNSNLIHHFSEKPTGGAEEGVKILAFEKTCDFTALNLSNVSTYKM